MESWQRWEDFLKIRSRDYDLTDAETESFLLQFARQNLGKSLKEISEQLPLMEDRLGNHKKRMSEVYRNFSKSCVELKSKTPNKSKPLQEWLETEYSQWLSVQDSDSALSSATTETPIYWRNICLAMLEAEKPLTTNALMRDEDDRFELEEIHVPLALVERKKPNLIGGDTQAEQGSRLYEPEYEEKQRFEHEQFLRDILKDGKGKQNGKRIAIIGEPGAGKTTLLRKIAFWVHKENTEILPISISLADLPETNPKQEFLEQFLLDKWLKAALPYISLEIVEVTEALKTEFKKLCNQGRVWLLLDGVDEISVQGEERLWAISNQLKGWVGQARVVLTCRLNVWEANRNVLADNFEIYHTLDFSYGDSTKPDRVEEFIAKWFNKQPNLGQELRQELDKPGKERIKDLVKNPLRLALLCSTWNLWRDRGGLPDTKAKLYQGFVEKFYEWKSREFPTNSTQREKLNRALGELAKLAIDQTESRFRLKHSLVCRVLGQPDEELFGLALKLGWLNELGLAAESPDETVYGFWHPTFEEYFAALAVDDYWDFFLNHVPENPKQGIYRIFEKQWKEVILLWLGRGEERLREQKEEFIDALVNFEDGCGQWDWEKIGKGFYQYRAYFLAASGINEFKSHPLANKIVNQLVNLGFGYFSHKKQEWQDYMGVMLGYVMINKILTQTDKLSTIQKICSLLENPQYPESSYRRAISVLGEIGQGNSQSIAVLKRVLNNTKNPEINRQVLISLNKIESGQLSPIDSSIKTTTTIPVHHKKSHPEEVDKIQHFIEVLLNEKNDNNTRMNALDKFKRASQEDSRIINALVEVIEKANDPSLRYLALHYLGKIEQGGITVTRVSMKILENFKKEDEDLRFKAVKSLRKSNPNNAGNNVDCLLSILNETKDPDLYIALLEALGKIGHDHPKAIATLTGILANTKDEEIRFQSADSLGRINPGNCKAVAVIIEILENTKHEYTSIVHDVLKPFLKPFEDLWESSKALDSLGEIGNGSKNAIHALVKVLEIAKAEYARRRATKSLLKIITTDEHRQEVVSLLQPHLKTETYENNFDLFNDCYVVLWDCAQNLPYPTFYEAWHDSATTRDPEVP
ncbi:MULTISPECIES: HEAT repeat domain-containing protein [unclassified Microcoleus]|uniref:HEAT repeat domain-containing protein n=1 Tax=unclassified Microcoleus TaxID=2642155 RepID=UPI002FCEDDB6